MSLEATIHGIIASSVAKDGGTTGPDPTGPHRYWRLYDGFGPGGNVQYGEIEFRDAVGGADQTGSGAAIASSEFNSGFLASQAFDDNLSIGWAAQGIRRQWIGYDFGSGNGLAMAEFTISERGSFGNEAWYGLTVQYSDDGSTWEPFAYVEGIELSSVSSRAVAFTSDFDGSPGLDLTVPHRFYRIVTLQEGFGNGFQQIANIQLQDFNGNSLMGTGGSGTADDEQNSTTFAGSNAWNQTDTDRWADNGTRESRILTWDFGVGNEQLVGRYSMQSFPGAQSSMPLGWRVEVSDDGATWQIVDWRWGEPDWASGEVRSFALSSIPTPAPTSDGNASVLSNSAILSVAKDITSGSAVSTTTIMKIAADTSSSSVVSNFAILTPLATQSSCSVVSFSAILGEQ